MSTPMADLLLPVPCETCIIIIIVIHMPVSAGRDNHKRLRAVDFTTKDDLPQSLPAGPNADRFDSSDDDEDDALPSPPPLPLRARGAGAPQQTLGPKPHSSQTHTVGDPHQQAPDPGLHLIGPRGEGDLGARGRETEREEKHTSPGPSSEEGVRTRDREATRVLRTSDGVTGMGPHEAESSGDDHESDPNGAESSGDDQLSDPCDAESSDDDSSSDGAGDTEGGADPGESPPGFASGNVIDGEEQGIKPGPQRQRHERGAPDDVGPMWAKGQLHNDNGIVSAGCLSSNSDTGVDLSDGDESAGAESDSEGTQTGVNGSIDDSGGAVGGAPNENGEMDVGEDDGGGEDDDPRHAEEAVCYAEDEDDEDDRSVVDEEHGGLEPGLSGDSLHSQGPEPMTETPRGGLAPDGGDGSDESGGAGDTEEGAGDVMSARVEGVDTYHVTAGTKPNGRLV
jgi:hypothetical protein